MAKEERDKEHPHLLSLKLGSQQVASQPTVWGQDSLAPVYAGCASVVVDDDGGDAIDTVGILIMLMVLVMKMMMV